MYNSSFLEARESMCFPMILLALALLILIFCTFATLDKHASDECRGWATSVGFSRFISCNRQRKEDGVPSKHLHRKIVEVIHSKVDRTESRPPYSKGGSLSRYPEQLEDSHLQDKLFTMAG